MSEDRTGEELGIARQGEDCRKLIEQRGWVLAGEYTDNDTSASGKVRRPEFDALLDAVARGELDAIVAWNLDRLTRNRRDQLRLVETCEPRSIMIALVRGSDIDMSTPSGRLTADILASVARHEIEVKSDRQKRASLQAAEAGKPPTGSRPFGFEDDKITKRKPEADAIKQAYYAVLSGEKSASIARAWNAAGLVSGKMRTGRGQKGEPSEWSAETVKALLLKPRNAGLRAYQGEIVGPGQQERIVDEEIWRAVVAKLTSRGRTPPGPRHLLSGFATCGICGGYIVAGARTADRFAYRCRTRMGGHVARRGDHADRYVCDAAIARLSRPDAVDLLAPQSTHDVMALRARAQMLRTRRDELASEFADDEDGVFTLAQFKGATRQINEKLAVVEADLAAAGRVDVLASVVGADDVEGAFEALSTDVKRAVIEAIMRVMLHPTGKGARRFDPATVEIIPVARMDEGRQVKGDGA